MMRRCLNMIGLAAAVVALAACGEKPQTIGGANADAAPYEGVGNSPFKQGDWTAGDKSGWEQQLKARAQYGMNEYTHATKQ